MIPTNLKTAIENLDESISKQNGRIFFSAEHTLVKGRFYLLGLNPGGNTADKNLAGTVTENQFPKEGNAYLDESWGTSKGKCRANGQHRIQRNVQDMLKMFGADCCENVCASNLIFRRTKSQHDLNYKTWAENCWIVHNEVLKIVQPNVIVVFGNGVVSPFDFLKKKLRGCNQECYASGHGGWCVKTFRATGNYGNFIVIGFPHFSRYSIDRLITSSYFKRIQDNVNEY